MRTEARHKTLIQQEKEKAMEEKTTFVELLNKAIGDHTKSDFAKASGIANAQLSRMLTGSAKSQPRPATLEKIAQASEGRVKIEELLLSCGHDIDEYNIKAEEKKNNTPEHERARAEIKELVQGFESYAGQRQTDMEDIFDTILFLYSGEETTLMAGAEKPCKRDVDPNAEQCILVTGNIALPDSRATCYILVTYNKTLSGAIIISKVTTKAVDIIRAGMLPKSAEQIEGISEMEETFFLKSSGVSEAEISAIRTNLEKLIGNEGDKYIGAVSGIGFTLPEKPDMEVLKTFVEAHRASYRRSELQQVEDYLGGNKDAVKDLLCRESGYAGWGAVISNAITKETGLPAAYWTQDYGQNDFEFADNPACIIVQDESEVLKDNGVNHVMDLLEPYARQLHIKTIGTCYFQSIFDKVKGEYRYLEEE